MTENHSSPDQGPAPADPNLAEVEAKIKAKVAEFNALKRQRHDLLASKPFNWEKDKEDYDNFEKPPHPTIRTYNSFSGHDISTLLISPERTGEDRIVRNVAEIMGISWEASGVWEMPVRGSIITLVFEKSLWPCLPVELGGILLQALSEDGRGSWLVLRDVNVSVRGGGISIDDITTDDNYTFNAKAIVGWIEGRAYRLENKEYKFTAEAIEALTGEPIESHSPSVRIVES